MGLVVARLAVTLGMHRRGQGVLVALGLSGAVQMATGIGLIFAGASVLRVCGVAIVAAAVVVAAEAAISKRRALLE